MRGPGKALALPGLRHSAGEYEAADARGRRIDRVGKFHLSDTSLHASLVSKGKDPTMPPVVLQVAETTRQDLFESAAVSHLDDLFRAAVHIIGDRADAEDLVQETYFQAWKSFDRFRLGTNCRAWLFKILFHVINHYRRTSFRIKRADEGQEFFEHRLVYEPPIPQDLRDEDVLDSLQKIPEQYREVVVLSDVYDFTYREIQDALGIPQGTVMSRLSRGRRLLRGRLAGFGREQCLRRRSRPTGAVAGAPV